MASTSDMTPANYLAEANMKNPDKMSHQELRNEIKKIRAAVSEQAEDEGLWFIAETAPEAYQQLELRRLHKIIEGEPG